MRGESLGTRWPPTSAVSPLSPCFVYTRLMASLGWSKGCSPGASLIFSFYLPDGSEFPQIYTAEVPLRNYGSIETIRVYTRAETDVQQDHQAAENCSNSCHISTSYYS